MAVPRLIKEKGNHIIHKSLMALALLVFLAYGMLFGIYPPAAPILLAGVIYFCLFFLHPFWGTLFFIFTLGFSSFFALPVTSDGLNLSTVVSVSVLAIWVVRSLVTKNPNLFLKNLSRPSRILLLAFFLLMCVSLVNSPNKPLSIRQIQIFCYCLATYFLIVNTVETYSQLYKVLIAVFLTGLLVSLVGVVESITQSSIYSMLGNRSLLMAQVGENVSLMHVGRINGPIGDAPFHGIYMVIIASVSLFLFFASSSRLLRLLSISTFLLAIFNILGTASRGALGGFAIAMAVFWLLAKIRGKWLILTSVIIGTSIIGGLILVASPETNIERLFSTDSKDTASIDMRWQNIPVAFAMFADHPFIGTGPDGFLANYRRYALGRAQQALRERTLKTHNTPVQILAEYGVVGGALFAFLIFLALRQIIRVRQGGEARFEFVSLSILGPLLAFIFFMMTSNTLLDQNFWMLMALSESLSNIDQEEAMLGSSPISEREAE